jgi:hypothetical protein
VGILISPQRSAANLDSVFDGDPRFQVGERRFVVTVHEPTSRSSVANGGTPVNNYDHCVLSVDALEEFVAARRVDPLLLLEHPEDPEVRLTSELPITFRLLPSSGPPVKASRVTFPNETGGDKPLGSNKEALWAASWSRYGLKARGDASCGLLRPS